MGEARELWDAGSGAVDAIQTPMAERDSTSALDQDWFASTLTLPHKEWEGGPDC